MAPFFILLGLFTSGVIVTSLWKGFKNVPWVQIVCWSLAIMLVVTGSAHFNSMRDDLIRMVPPALPNPGLLVTLTGIFEFLGAGGLLFRKTRVITGILLAALFVGLLPANIYADLKDLTLGGQPVTPLYFRIPIQLVFIGFALVPVIASQLKIRRIKGRT